MFREEVEKLAAIRLELQHLLNEMGEVSNRLSQDWNYDFDHIDDISARLEFCSTWFNSVFFETQTPSGDC